MSRIGYVIAMVLVARPAWAEPAEPAASYPLDAPSEARAATPEQHKNERATLLAAHIPRHLELENPVGPRVAASAIGIISVGVTTYWLVQGVTFDAASTLMLTGFGTLAVGGVTAFVVPGELARDAVFSGLWLGLGSVVLGLDLATNDGASVSGIALSSGYYLSAALAVAGMLVRRRTPRSKLTAHYRRIRTPNGRATLSEASVLAIERDFSNATRPLPWPVLHLPVMTGASVAIVAAAFEDESAMAALALPALLGGLFASLGGETFPLYEDHLKRTGLALRVGPSPTAGPGMSLSGVF